MSNTAMMQGLAGTTWAIDGAHSNVEFAVKHMMLATVKGRFGEVSGTISFDGAGPESARVEVVIPVESIDTRSAQRDAHLRSGDFFDAGSHPELRFVSRKVEAAGADAFRVTGDLTIRGLTREVVLDATYEGHGQDPWGGTRMAFHATTRVDRRDFGLSWNQALEAGGVLVGETVRIVIDAEVVAS